MVKYKTFVLNICESCDSKFTIQCSYQVSEYTAGDIKSNLKRRLNG